MSDKTNSSSTSRVSVVLWFVVGVLCLGEFVRVELILNEHRTRLDKIEEKTDRKDVEPFDVKTKQMKGDLTDDSTEVTDVVSRQRARRNTVSSPSNNSNIQAVRKELLQTMGVELKKAFTKACGAKSNGCPPGPPGPPGRPGRKGSTGKRGPPGRRGKRGHQGPMGMPGRSGKQGMMGPVGLKGQKGERGNRGLPGVAGRDGRPGQSISAPDITVSPPLLIVDESETAVLHCAGRGNPRPVIGWTRVGGLLDKRSTVLDGRAGVVWNHNLQIKNVNSKDSGVYECKGSNILGQAHQSATLVVNSLDACTGFRCNKPHSTCENINGKPVCVCPITPCPTSAQPFCASDGKTYDNECAMKKAACQKGVNIRFVKRGQCECKVVSDVSFLVDSSGSIGRRNWKRLLQFVSSTISKLNVGPRGSHIALVRYSTQPEVDFTFTSVPVISAANYNKIILNLRWQRGYTFIDRALLMADQRIFVPVAGMRSNVPKMAFVITDGMQTRTQGRITPLATASARLKAKGVRVYGMGIGSNVSGRELRDIASSPRYIYQASSFKLLTKEINGIVRSMCEG